MHRIIDNLPNTAAYLPNTTAHSTICLHLQHYAKQNITTTTHPCQPKWCRKHYQKSELVVTMK